MKVFLKSIIITSLLSVLNASASSLCEQIHSNPEGYFSKKIEMSLNDVLQEDASLECDGSLFLVPELKNIYNLTLKIRGDSLDCSGNKILINQRKFKYILARAGIFPQFYKTQKISNEKIEKNKDYFRIWAYKSFSNFQLYTAFNDELRKDMPFLVKFYQSKFGFDDGSAIFYASNALNEYLNYAVGGYKGNEKLSKLQNFILNPAYKAEDLLSFLYSNVFTPYELDQGLQTAILENRSLQYLDVLIKYGANVNFGDENSLFFALKNLSMMKFLLSKGADINYKNSFGKSLIFYAVELCDENLVRFLIENGANVNDVYISNYEKMASVSIADNYEGGNDSLCALNHTSRTLLMHASLRSNKNIVEFIIKKGGKKEAVDDLGFNALDYAIKADNKEVIRYLKSIGMSANKGEEINE